MRLALITTLLGSLFTFAAPARAQDEAAGPLERGTWDLGAFVGGGNGLVGASAADTRYFVAGIRIGRVLSQEHFSGWVRGNFEYAGDFMPAFVVFQPGGAVYGGNFTPIMLVWNFTANRKIVPYLLLSGGGLVSTDNVPRGPTSNFNFVPGGSFGVHLFTRPGGALTLETHWIHISNANLGYNPQLVSNFVFTVGYTWLK